MNVSPTRPALIAEHPHFVREPLHEYGISARTLLLDEAHGKLIIPPTTPPLMMDFRGLTETKAARLLCELPQYQRKTQIVPHILVNQSMVGVQRLIAGCTDVKAIIIDPEPIDTLIQWLWAPVHLAPQQVWVNIEKPVALTKRPYLTKLVAALEGAVSIEHAAYRCAIAPNTAYNLLHQCCSGAPARCSVQAWREALLTALRQG